MRRKVLIQLFCIDARIQSIEKLFKFIENIFIISFATSLSEANDLQSVTLI